MEFLRSFLRLHFARKPGLASRNFGSPLSLYSVIDNSPKTRVRRQASPIMSSLLVSGKRGELLRNFSNFHHFLEIVDFSTSLSGRLHPEHRLVSPVEVKIANKIFELLPETERVTEMNL